MIALTPHKQKNKTGLTDITFSLPGYCWVITCAVSTALYLLFISKLGAESGTICVSSYCCMCPHTAICVVIPLNMCPHTAISSALVNSVLSLVLHVCSHTAVYVPSYCYICVLILLSPLHSLVNWLPSLALCVFPHAAICVLISLAPLH